MDATFIQQQLKDGILAVRRGDRAQGRDLLLQVVAADNRIEPAWFWLSQVMDDPADQLIALENVLALNPANEAARAAIEPLRQRLGLVPAPAVAAPPPPPETPGSAAPAAPPATLPSDDEALDNDPDQCLYCGKITESEAAACPHCGRSLLRAGPLEGKAAYVGLILVSVAILQFSILQPGATLIAVLAQSGEVTAFLSSALFWVMLARITLWLISFLFIITSQVVAPIAAAGAGVIDWAIIGLSVVLGWLTKGPAVTYAVLDLGLVGLATSVLVGRAQARVRQHLVVDRDAYGHGEMYRRGEDYARQGKWALAALHWQKAMVLRPSIAQYYKSLSLAQARLGRHAQALRTLRSGAEMIPDDPDWPALVTMLKAQTQRPGPKAKGDR